MTEAVAIERLSQTMLAFFDAHAARGDSMTLVTVLSTEGSSYSKAGHPLLVSDSGELAGLLSGGCLENHLIERCGETLRSGEPRLIEYDLRDDDELFGLGVGCEGVMRVLLYPTFSADDYAPIGRIRRLLRDRQFVDLDVRSGESARHLRWIRPARLLVLGAGPDALPLLQMCRSLGWRVTVNDHRPAWIARVAADETTRVSQAAPGNLAREVDLGDFDAAIVMSHNLDADCDYLAQLATTDVGFVGLLGPPHRRERILGKIGQSSLLEGRLRSPVGIRIGGRGPGAIALEIVAELQAYFCDLDKRLATAARSDGVSISIDAGSNATVTTA